MRLDQQFIQWLVRKGRTLPLAERKAKLAFAYETWLNQRGVVIADSGYADLMEYVAHLQDLDYSVHMLNRTLQALSDYYTYLELENVAYSLRIRGAIHKQIGTQFTAEQLDEIYNCFEVNLGSWGYYYHTDRIVLGLIIYQGLELNSFFKIRVKDVDFRNARIRIRAHNGRKERYIPLQGHQIYELHEWMLNRREVIDEWLWKRKYISESRKQITDVLFSPQCEKYSRMHEQLKGLSKEIKRQVSKKLGYEVRKLTHFRQSRICVWIEQHGLRKAQYLAGLRSVMSVERYKRKDLKGLKSAVEKWHPR